MAAKLKIVADPLPIDFGRDKPVCVYLYRDPRKKREAIYVGMGDTQTRPDFHWTIGSHNKGLRDILSDIREAGLVPIIEYVGFFDDDKDALKLERILIAKYGQRDKGTGTLCNVSPGVLRNKPKTGVSQRLQIILLPQQWEWLRTEAAKTGASLAELIRRAIDRCRDQDKANPRSNAK